MTVPLTVVTMEGTMVGLFPRQPRSAVSNRSPSGTPRPVQVSQPLPARYAPFDPVVMSRKPGGATPGFAAA